jgi:hypothetical protein
MAKWSFLLSLLFLAGCSTGGGSSSSGSQTPQNISVAGQWDAIATPTNNPSAFYNYYVNVTNQGGSISAASGSVIGCLHDDCVPGFFKAPQGYALNGTVTGNQLSITLTGGGGYSATLTGTVSADGSSMSGTYTDSSPVGATGPGTWVAQKRSAVTGTYSGSFNSALNPSPIPFTVTGSITQAADYSVTGSATISNSTCFTTLAFGQGSRAIGGAFSLVDSTSGVTIEVYPNENGTLTSTSLYSSYAITSGSCSGDTGIGTVTKQ